MLLSPRVDRIKGETQFALHFYEPSRLRWWWWPRIAARPPPPPITAAKVPPAAVAAPRAATARRKNEEAADNRKTRLLRPRQCHLSTQIPQLPYMFALVNKKRASIDRQYRFLFLLTHSNDAASYLLRTRRLIFTHWGKIILEAASCSFGCTNDPEHGSVL